MGQIGYGRQERTGHAAASVDRRLLATLGALALIVGTTASWSVDGVIEINQASVQAGGGFPYTIGSSGSYRLTGDLDVTGEPNPEDVTAIVITADDVTLDLNGFTITGPTSCGGDPMVCGPVGSGLGIQAAASLENIRVRNGSVHGMGGGGIALGHAARVWDVHVTGNGGTGLFLDRRGHVARVVADLNATEGISVSIGCTVTDSSAISNGGDGITASDSALVIGNSAHSNHGDGIRLYSSVLVEGNTSYQNDGAGIRFFPDPAFGAYKDNVVDSNTVDSIIGGTEIGTNFCNGSTTC
jgi:hypothetical protein